jgi:hypothetical protein
MHMGPGVIHPRWRGTPERCEAVGIVAEELGVYRAPAHSQKMSAVSTHQTVQTY